VICDDEIEQENIDKYNNGVVIERQDAVDADKA
jgi:hypothetical protein